MNLIHVLAKRYELVKTTSMFSFYFLFSFRSSTTPRNPPSQPDHRSNLRCVICENFQNKGIKEKKRIAESSSAKCFREAAEFFMDDVYTRICDLENDENMYGADLLYHHSCLSSYIKKHKRALQAQEKGFHYLKTTKRQIFENYKEFIKEIIDSGSGISLSDIRDMLNEKEEFVFNNSEIKTFLISAFTDEIQFSNSDKVNESQIAFSSKIDIQDIVQILRKINIIKEAAVQIRQGFSSMNFNINNKFCDAEELAETRDNFNIPDETIAFFSTLFNVNAASLKQNFPLQQYEDDNNDFNEINENGDNDDTTTGSCTKKI